MKRIIRQSVIKQWLCLLLIGCFACQSEDKILSETFYKVYETELSGRLFSTPTTDLGVLVQENEVAIIMGNLGENIAITQPRLIKLDLAGGLEWAFYDGSYFRPLLVVEKATYFVLFTATTYDSDGGQNYFTNYTSMAEVHIDKKTGKEINRILYPAEQFNQYLYMTPISNNRYLAMGGSNGNTEIAIFGENFQLLNTKSLPGKAFTLPVFFEESENHFIFNQTNFILNQAVDNQSSFLFALDKDLSEIRGLAFSSRNVILEQGLITDIFPINDKEFISTIYSTAGLQVSIYMLPPISLEKELKSTSLKEPIFWNKINLWHPTMQGGSITTEHSEYFNLMGRLGTEFMTPLRAESFFERAKKTGTLFRTFDIDFNDRENFIRKTKDRILIVRNTGSYQIVIFEYLVEEKKFKLLQTLGRNIPYYIQSVSVNEHGDLFIVGNTQIAKDLNSLFVIKIPYEDLPK